MIAPGDVQLLMALFDIASKAIASIKAIKTDKPEVYAAVGAHHAASLAAAQAALDDAHVPSPNDSHGPIL